MMSVNFPILTSDICLVCWITMNGISVSWPHLENSTPRLGATRLLHLDWGHMLDSYGGTMWMVWDHSIVRCKGALGMHSTGCSESKISCRPACYQTCRIPEEPSVFPHLCFIALRERSSPMSIHKIRLMLAESLPDVQPLTSHCTTKSLFRLLLG
jgi:hypothetical protein